MMDLVGVAALVAEVDFVVVGACLEGTGVEAEGLEVEEEGIVEDLGIGPPEGGLIGPQEASLMTGQNFMLT